MRSRTRTLRWRDPATSRHTLVSIPLGHLLIQASAGLTLQLRPQLQPQHLRHPLQRQPLRLLPLHLPTGVATVYTVDGMMRSARAPATLPHVEKRQSRSVITSAALAARALERLRRQQLQRQRLQTTTLIVPTAAVVSEPPLREMTAKIQTASLVRASRFATEGMVSWRVMLLPVTSTGVKWLAEEILGLNAR